VERERRKTGLTTSFAIDVVVGRGFVVSPEESRTSSQIDVLIYDGSKPVLFRDGDLVFVTADAVLAVIDVKTVITPTTLREALVKLHRNIGIVRQAPNTRACAGLFAFEDGGGESASFLAAIKEQSGELMQYVDFVAIGPNRFIRFWELTPEKPTRFFHSWRSYQMPGLAAGYFLHNVVDSIAQLSPTTSGAWFPAEGKEIYSDGEMKASWAATAEPVRPGRRCGAWLKQSAC
jgi:hypothetical protein